ncbi:deoxyribodipyrimidine photo-lyase [Desulfovibrio sp. JC022]|uniref:deoxyribodipyrimidine photo-lyase n=1 Tax=Desulfovibrio sp. JC022 TaxID=2593642 RepID=UPI0013D1519F|nr:deoxyribodipyrimidine photo-lyase [Desulfovibrio sp. JC022]NDV21404.1 deoxyribodipyrimidine photo-lyase [Desulfovibrio sp. JC022]
MIKVDHRRIHYLNSADKLEGPIIYWMSREQRVRDNWGLLHCRELAGAEAPLIVVFCLVPSFLGATLRHYDFMLKGLQQVERDLRSLGYDFVLLSGAPDKVLPDFVRKVRAGAVVTDFDPLRIKRQWQDHLSLNIDIPLIEVDGHNIVPARFVTDKREYGARTVRPKIHRLLPEFLEDFPELDFAEVKGESFPAVDWEQMRKSLEVDDTVGPVELPSGEESAHIALDEFVGLGLGEYADKRNDPNGESTSRLSAYYHFGQLAPQRAALTVATSLPGDGAQSYLEELIVRRELADNFCLHTLNYDSLEAAPEWALKTLAEHSDDIRPYLYTYENFEQARTHSTLWNAAQNQMVRSGFMHGYMRMFWAKKILEWSASPEEALRITIALNDRFQLDGRDPNGYVGALWSIAGLHDRAWKKRSVFGSIRYMNERGCRRKFDVDTYIEKWGLGT